MPLPVIPPLTVAATAILRYGLANASKKYSPKAIEFAKKRLVERAKALKDRERGAEIMTGGVKRIGPKPPPRRNIAPSGLGHKSGFFSEGGEVTSVRGAGKAVRGVRPAKIY
tara:strand:+ start:1432 stop:1767 length:336 start_codon:yes stop_codon:yes gene_type:complete